MLNFRSKPPFIFNDLLAIQAPFYLFTDLSLVIQECLYFYRPQSCDPGTLYFFTDLDLAIQAPFLQYWPEFVHEKRLRLNASTAAVLQQIQHTRYLQRITVNADRFGLRTLIASWTKNMIPAIRDVATVPCIISSVARNKFFFSTKNLWQQCLTNAFSTIILEQFSLHHLLFVICSTRESYNFLIQCQISRILTKLVSLTVLFKIEPWFYLFVCVFG